jgi:hypothetical protein
MTAEHRPGRGLRRAGMAADGLLSVLDRGVSIGGMAVVARLVRAPDGLRSI